MIDTGNTAFMILCTSLVIADRQDDARASYGRERCQRWRNWH